MKRLANSHFFQQTIWALGGQIAYLLANFLLFIMLVNQVPKEVYGTWALFITFVSIADSIRQGMVQNGLSRLIVVNPEDAALRSTGTVLNFSIIAGIGLIFATVPSLFTSSEELIHILRHAWKSLLLMGTILFMATLCQSRQDLKKYFKINLIYLITFVSLLYYMRVQGGEISLVQIINLQVLAVIPSVIYFIATSKIELKKPDYQHLLDLFHFGKYATGTNLLSMLFHKADIIMIAYFLDPVAVAVYHFTTKIMNYAELPLHALSQVIYPRITRSYRTASYSALKHEYGMSLIRLLFFVIPICIFLILFNPYVISILSSEDYSAASQLVVILSIGMIFKPFGRVYGLTLDAIGKPGINFYMLLMSFFINLIMNVILIPSMGVSGAALATCTSIIITILIGQLTIGRFTPIRPLKDMLHSLRIQLSVVKKFQPSHQ